MRKIRSGKISSKKAIRGSRKALKHSDEDINQYPDSSIHHNTTISLLEDIGGGTVAVPALIHYLNDSGEDLPFRLNIILTLAEISSEATIKPFISTIVKSLIPFLEESDYRFRQKAVRALSEIGGSEAAIPGLVKALEDSDLDVRRDAPKALGKIGSEATLTALFNALKNPKFIAANNEDTFYRTYSAISTIQNKLKYYRPPQPIPPSLESPNHPESKNTIIAQYVQIIEKGDGKIQNSP